MHVSWARHHDEVREAQRLRHAVFAGELGARLASPVEGHDVDRFDDFCDHLLVRLSAPGPVIGTCRVLTPGQARRAGGGYCEQEFDLAPLAALRLGMAELGRSCVHVDHRRGTVVLALWGALAAFLDLHDLDSVLGCVSVGAATAAALWHRLRGTHLAAPPLCVTPRQPLPLGPPSGPPPEPPALLRGYLHVGARVLGPPAWDPAFGCADLPVLARTIDLPRRYRRVPAA